MLYGVEKVYGFVRNLPLNVITPVMLLFAVGYAGATINNNRGEE